MKAGIETPEIDVEVRKNGVFLKFPIVYMVLRFDSRIPDLIMLICGGREVKARLYTVRHNIVEYRVYSKYVSAVLDNNECVFLSTS